MERNNRNRTPDAVTMDIFSMVPDESFDGSHHQPDYDELPDFANEDDWDELPDFEEETKEYDIKARLEAVHSQMRRGYISAYLILNPKLSIDEFDTRTNTDYIKWVYNKHNVFCDAHGINRKKNGYTAKNIMDFEDFLYSEIDPLVI